MNPTIAAQLPNIAGGASTTGQMELGQIEELQKALTAGYGTDVAQFTGAAAFRIQSLDKTMKATIQENKHFRLFNELIKNSATATVDEWSEQSSVGGFLGGSTNTETGVIASAQGTYARRVGLVKYLMTRREVSLVATLGNNLANAESVEQNAGAKQLLTDAEYLSFEGDSAVVGTEFDGIFAQIAAGIAAGQVDPANMIDVDGATLNNIDYVTQAAAQISAFGNFGQPTHIFCSQQVQADFDTNLDPAFRVPLTDVANGGISLGSPVKGIRTSWGDIANMPDVFVRDQQMMIPFEAASAEYQAVATAQAALQPAAVAYDASVSDASSKFTALRAGNYYYLVCGLNASGQSTGVVSAQQVVASGKKVSITITKSAGGAETGYAIYRSTQNADATVANMRLMARVARTGNSTVYVDLNRDIPGSTRAYILNLRAGDDAINWRQLLPMLKFPLYPTQSATIPWAQLMFGYLRITKRKHHAVIKNIIPSKSAWKPFVAGA
jgi:hypothetical protein